MGELLWFCVINNFLVLSSVSSLSYKLPPDFASQTTPVQITWFSCTINMINYACVLLTWFCTKYNFDSQENN